MASPNEQGILSATEVRQIASEKGYTESTNPRTVDLLIFKKNNHESEFGSIPIPVCVEAYVAEGDVACYVPHPRQKAYRIFHFGALHSQKAFEVILTSPFNDNIFNFCFSDILYRPSSSLALNPPPCQLTTALERQIMLVERELGDLTREKHALKKRREEFYSPPKMSKINSFASSEDDVRSGTSRVRNCLSNSSQLANKGFDTSDAKTSVLTSSKTNESRVRGNKGVWSMIFANVQEEFARSWNLKSVASVALGRGFVVCYDDGTVRWSDITGLLENKLHQQGIYSTSSDTSPKSAVQIRYLVLGDEGNFYVKFDNGRMEWCGQESFGAALRRGVSEKHMLVERVAYAQDGGWLIIWSDRSFEAMNIPETLEMKLQGTKQSDGRIIGSSAGIKDITLGPNGEWFVIYRDHSVQADNLPDGLYKYLSQIRDRNGRVRSIAFGENHSWFVRYWDNKA